MSEKQQNGTIIVQNQDKKGEWRGGRNRELSAQRRDHRQDRRNDYRDNFGQSQHPNRGGRGAKSRSRGGDRRMEHQGDRGSSDSISASPPTRKIVFNPNAAAWRPSASSSSSSRGNAPSTSPPVVQHTPSRRRDQPLFTENANHLLNFSFTRREPEPPIRRSKGPVVRFKKERFLQANYRFVVNSKYNCAQYLYVPEEPVMDWDNIEQICLSSSVPQSCPICLDTPMAPKMTKCGHIYCWTCILRYLSMGDKDWRKCPICFDAVSAKQLKSATIELTPSYREGDQISFTLMARRKDCMLAIPAAHWRPIEDLLSYNDEDSIFARVVRINDATPILDREQAELSEILAMSQASGEEGQVPFVTQAMHFIEERRAAIKNASESKVSSTAQEGIPTSVEVPHIHPEHPPVEVPRMSSVWSDDEDGDRRTSESPPTPTPLLLGGSKRLGDQPRERTAGHTNLPKGNEVFYFYQASMGQHIYLHPLDVRCLLTEHGSYEQLPHTIEGTVIDLEEIAQSEKMRKRRKSIVGHLPLGTDFRFCEIDISRLVSKATLEECKDDLHFREEARRQRKREEEEAEANSNVKAAMLARREISLMEAMELEGGPTPQSYTEIAENSASHPLDERVSGEPRDNAEVATLRAPTNVWAARAQQAKQSASDGKPQPLQQQSGVPSFLAVLNNTAPAPLSTIIAAHKKPGGGGASSPAPKPSSAHPQLSSAGKASAESAPTAAQPNGGKGRAKQRRAKQIVLFSTSG